MTGGSITDHGWERSAGLPKIAWQSPGGFAPAVWTNAVHKNQTTARETMFAIAAIVDGSHIPLVKVVRNAAVQRPMNIAVASAAKKKEDRSGDPFPKYV